MAKKTRFSLDDEHDNEEYEQDNYEHENETYDAHNQGYGEGCDDDNGLSEEELVSDKDNLINFLKFPKNKRALKDFIETTYKNYEEEDVQRTINRKVYEHHSELEGSTPYHKPGHIGPLMYEYLNMVGVENAFTSGLQHTKSSLTKTIQQRVDEVNTLLRGVGGFNRQIKASFSRSAVVYLEQEDPKNTHRERVVFTVNIGDFELRYPLDESSDNELTEDGRSLRRLVWDEAVNTLSEIISNTGLKPKYVKNDKYDCNLVMRQYLQREGQSLPDEYFAFELKHLDEDKIEISKIDYDKKISEFDKQLNKVDRSIKSSFTGRRKREDLIRKKDLVTSEKEFYIATTPDPSELDTGLVFSIYINTMKDYTLTKDKMQVIMTKFILAVSNIATDKSMDEQVNTVYQQKQAATSNIQDLSEKVQNKSTKGNMRRPRKKVA